MITPPGGCRWCGVEEFGHAQPTQPQILARMRADRAHRKAAMTTTSRADRIATNLAALTDLTPLLPATARSVDAYPCLRIDLDPHPTAPTALLWALDHLTDPRIDAIADETPGQHRAWRVRLSVTGTWRGHEIEVSSEQVDRRPGPLGFRDHPLVTAIWGEQAAIAVAVDDFTPLTTDQLRALAGLTPSA